MVEIRTGLTRHDERHDERHDQKVARAAARMRALAATGRTVRLRKQSSNLFRVRPRPASGTLDVTGFDGVLDVDPAGGTMTVEGMCTYGTAVDVALAHGVVPAVVPQLTQITVGGAVAGVGIESSSFRHGFVHETVREADVLVGSGDVVTARDDNDHADLFRAFPNSYGCFGYALRVVLDVVPVRPFVALRHERFAAGADETYFAAVREACATGRGGGAPDFVDGIVVAGDAAYLTTGGFVDDVAATSDYTRSQVYWRSITRRRDDALTVHDYLWRWDTDWFWCSDTFKVQNPWVRAVVPKRLLGSATYMRLYAWDRRHGWSDTVRRLRRRPPREMVVQDVEIPIDAAAEFVRFFEAEVGISPVWVCPVQQRDRRTWDLYRMDPDTLYVNFGFWSSVPVRPGARPDGVNRAIEREITALGGRKSLYSTSSWTREEFDRLYGGSTRQAVKQRYDPAGVLVDSFDKCVGGDGG